MTTTAITLAEHQLDAIADRVAARLAKLLPGDENASAAGPLVDAATVAAALGVSRETVYTHAGELGGVRIGNGSRGRLRFDLRRALTAWTSCSERKGSPTPKPPQTKASRRGRRRPKGSGVDLLPIRGPRTPVFDDVESI
jgi:hypothetical protein